MRSVVSGCFPPSTTRLVAAQIRVSLPSVVSSWLAVIVSPSAVVPSARINQPASVGVHTPWVTPPLESKIHETMHLRAAFQPMRILPVWGSPSAVVVSVSPARNLPVGSQPNAMSSLTPSLEREVHSPLMTSARPASWPIASVASLRLRVLAICQIPRVFFAKTAV